jgi:hypothetical protein
MISKLRSKLGLPLIPPKSDWSFLDWDEKNFIKYSLSYHDKSANHTCPSNKHHF